MVNLFIFKCSEMSNMIRGQNEGGQKLSRPTLNEMAVVAVVVVVSFVCVVRPDAERVRLEKRIKTEKPAMERERRKR